MRPDSLRTARRIGLAGAVMALLLAMLAPAALRAEPYLAVRTGAKCMACHVNPSGGGKRNEFGGAYAQTALAQDRLDPTSALWSGQLNERFALGADLRATFQSVKVPGAKETLGFNPTRAQVYLEVQPIAKRLTFYLDERVAPGAATNREAWALLWLADRSAYVKAGRMFVPFGLRIEDDSAFTRQVSGENFSASDDGIEGGLELGPWSASVSVTNGARGGAETNRGKLVSALASYVQPDWRFGVSGSANSNGTADRRVLAAFGGLRTGIVSWLASVVSAIEDETPFGRQRHWATLFEGNVEFAKGHNLKLTYENQDPDTHVPNDRRARYSAVWEVVPFQFTQLRLGARKNDGIPQNQPQNATEVFAQWHAFF